MFSMRKVVVFILAALLMAASTLLSQTGTGEVTGIITDPSGALIPGAAVILTNKGTNIQSKVATNQSGSYAFVNVIPGSFTLSVEAAGFKTASVPAFDVGVSQAVTRNVSLTIGAVGQTVEVSATAPLLQSSSTELGTVITTKAVNDLPLNGRNFTELMLLTPGVTPVNVSQGGGPGTPDGGIIAIPSATVVKPSFHGSENRSVVFYEDGIINTDFRGNVPGVQPNIDLVQEFTVVSHDTRADVGGVIGGVVNIVSKSGTNQWHGSGFEFVRNNAFDARDTFKDISTARNPTAKIAAYHQNQFGATFGGPIKHDRTFIYGGYSGWRYSKPTQGFSRVPTAAELNGDFTANSGSSGFKDVLPIYNPYSTHKTGTDSKGNPIFGRDPFKCDASGNPIVPNADSTQTGGTACQKIPSQLISPVMQSLLTTYIDVPNLTGNPSHNFIENLAATNGENDVSVRVDHRLSERDNLFFRYSEMWDNAISAATPKTHNPSKYHEDNEGGGWTHSFAANLILDVRGGYVGGPVDDFALSNLGTAPEQKFFSDIKTFGGLNVALASPYSGVGNGFIPNRDNFRNNPGWNATANLNWIKGRHNLKLGYDYNLTSRIQINQFEEFDFTNDITGAPGNGKTGNSLASSLLGFPAQFIGQLKDHSEVHLNAPEWALYAQDEWKVKPKVTIAWGLRWDVNPRSTIVGPRVSDAVDLFHQQYLVGLSAFPPLCSAGPADPCMPQVLANIPDNDHIVLAGKKLLVPTPEYDQFGPRVGVAWQMNPTIVFRAGYGLYFDTLIARTQTAQNDLEQLAWPYTTGFNGSANAPTSAGVPAGATGNPLTPITSIEGSFPNPVPAPAPWTPSGWADDPASRDPYSHEWNIEMQKQFAHELMFSAAYVGSNSQRLAYTGVNVNAASQPSPAGTPLATIDSYRLMPFLEGNLRYTQTIGYANYNALQLKLVRRFSNGLQSQLSYTWSKSMDISSGYYDVEGGAGARGVQDYFHPRSNYSVSGFDVPNYLTWFTVWDVPLGRGKRWLSSGPASWILGNWQVNSILQARSGQVYNLGVKGTDIANIFGTDTAGDRGNYERPNLIANPFQAGPVPSNPDPTCAATISQTLVVGGKTVQGTAADRTRSVATWFNPCAYAVPAIGSYGSNGRNTLRDPGVFNTDFSLFKNIPLGESRQVQLRFESFNIFNVVNWSTPSTTIGSGGAGATTSLATSPRQVQFGIRFIF